MACWRKMMTMEEAPFVVTFPGRFGGSVKASVNIVREHLEWLKDEDNEHGTHGTFINGYDPLNDVSWYRFTDEQTAVIFRLRFG